MVGREFSTPIILRARRGEKRKKKKQGFSFVTDILNLGPKRGSCCCVCYFLDYTSELAVYTTFNTSNMMYDVDDDLQKRQQEE